jgi:hypothetical protein
VHSILYKRYTIYVYSHRKYNKSFSYSVKLIYFQECNCTSTQYVHFKLYERARYDYTVFCVLKSLRYSWPKEAFLSKSYLYLYEFSVNEQRELEGYKILTNNRNLVYRNHKVRIYLQSATVYVPSSEFGLSHPLSRQRVFLFPRNQRGEGAH